MSAKILQPIRLPRIAHYPGAVEELAESVRACRSEPGYLVLVTGQRTLERLPGARQELEILEQEGWSVIRVQAEGEPSAEWVDEQRRASLGGRGDVVVAIGGGSALDVGKTLAAMAREPGPTKAYLEGVGDRTPSGDRLPWIAVPTTMGTGSEATYNAVLGQPALEGGYKKSLRHPGYVADRVVLDARLSVGLPSHVVASAGMDAFSQLLESYLAPTSSPLLDRWLVYGLELATEALPQLIHEHGERDLEAQRHDMALAATLSGVALTCTGLGTVHGLIGPLGAVSPAAHGVACANVLPAAMRHTLAAARSCGGADRAFVEGRMAEIGAMLEGPDGGPAGEAERADALIEALEAWRAEARARTGLAALSEAGVTEQHVGAVIAKASNRRNPVALSEDQWRAILENACDARG